MSMNLNLPKIDFLTVLAIGGFAMIFFSYGKDNIGFAVMGVGVLLIAVGAFMFVSVK